MQHKEVCEAVGRLYLQKNAEFNIEMQQIVQDAGLTKEAFLPAGVLGGGVGALRTMNLSEEEKALLREQYGLEDDANIAARNALRGVAGDIAGTAAVGIPAAFGVAATMNRNPKMLPAALGASALGVNLGSILGSKLMTDKYSADAIKQLIEEKKKALQEQLV